MPDSPATPTGSAPETSGTSPTPSPVAPVAPASAPVAPPSPPGVTYGEVPRTLNDIFYKVWPNILLVIVTCGIWACVWTYRTHGDLKRYKGDGLGEVPGLLLALFISPVIMFTVPYETQQMYERDGRESPVSTLWGLWFLLPIIGNFIWYFKVQAALNDFWVSKGTQPAV